MSFFGNLFGKKAELPEPGPGAPVAFFPGPGEIDMSNWDQVFSACLGKMYTVQNALARMVKDEADWNVDFEAGVLKLGKYRFRIQFLGSESNVTHTWLWGWENVNHFSNDLLAQAYMAQVYGRTWKLEPLIYAQCEINDTFNGHNLSMVACGALAEDRCYYRCPTGNGQGAAFVALCDMPKELFQPVDGITFINSSIQCVQRFYLDHKIFVEAFLRWNQTAFEWNGDNLIAHFDKDVLVEFERAGENYRIKNMKQ